MFVVFLVKQLKISERHIADCHIEKAVGKLGVFIALYGNGIFLIKLHALPEKEENEVIEDDRPDNRTREVQAESIAYTVCQHFGIDTSDYSFGYVAGWSSGKETAELKASLEVIRATADEMITDISEKLKELEKVQENDIDGKDTKQADKAKNTSKKPSIRKQLKEEKAKTEKAPKKPAKKKAQDLEV